MNSPATLVIVDDHPLVRAGLRTYFAGIQGYAVVATGGDAHEAVRLCGEHRPDVLVLDVEMPGRDALGAMADIKATSPGTRIVLFTAFCRDAIIEAAVRGGAAGYLLKSDSPEEVCGALARLLQGKRVYSKAVAARMARPDGTAGPDGQVLTALAALHPRELEVLRYIGKGMTNTEMAKAMHLSIRTVERHVLRLMRHLKIDDRTKLTDLAHTSGLVN